MVGRLLEHHPDLIEFLEKLLLQILHVDLGEPRLVLAFNQVENFLVDHEVFRRRERRVDENELDLFLQDFLQGLGLLFHEVSVGAVPVQAEDFWLGHCKISDVNKIC